jgi:LacI family kdg operon repressor
MKDEGVRIATDLGVCSFDDWGWASLIGPGITAVTQDSYQVGMQAALLLLKMINGAVLEDVMYMELPNKLIVRGSTSPLVVEGFANGATQTGTIVSISNSKEGKSCSKL